MRRPQPQDAGEGESRRTARGRHAPRTPPGPSGKPLDVTVGLIHREGRYLIGRRLPGSRFAGQWEFLGGKREPGESSTACLAREVREELGVEIRIGRKCGVVTHRYPDRTLRLHVYDCVIVNGRPRPIGCEALQWVSREELAAYTFPPANAGILRKLATGAW